MISFYPGPSRVHDQIPTYVKEAARLGIMSMNHRSDQCMGMIKKTVSLLQKKLSIPNSYTILFTNSATECWEIIAQSYAEKSFHFYNGAFGKRWFDYTRKLKPHTQSIAFNRDHILEPDAFAYPSTNGIICLTQNETSNGTQISNDIIEKFRQKTPHSLIAIDATSSMAGVHLNFRVADIWFASVQKCFGLPAGLGIMICSPEAIARAKVQGINQHYNSLCFMVEMMDKYQTPFTPNVLGIYLLMRVLEKSKAIREVDKVTKQRFKLWDRFLSKQKKIKQLINNPLVRSYTVLTLQSDYVKELKKRAKQKGFLLGDGYGDLKDTTFRIANFPALKDKEIKSLQKFLQEDR